MVTLHCVSQEDDDDDDDEEEHILGLDDLKKLKSGSAVSTEYTMSTEPAVVTVTCADAQTAVSEN